MTSAAETFVVALAKASKQARWHLRGLSRADRDDVLSTAILWCWDNRAKYNPAIPLDRWFIGAVRNARKAFERGEAHHAEEVVEAIAAPDDPSWHVEVEQALERLKHNMDERDRKIVSLCLKGLDHGAIAEKLSISLPTVSRRLARMRTYVPESENFKLAIRKAHIADSDDMDGDSKPAIDKEIERLEFAPPAGQDCPPCWRCKWFDGYVPTPNTVRRSPIIVEPEIRAAVLDIEARKIEIAYAIRKG